jgi:hypothetical protein
LKERRKDMEEKKVVTYDRLKQYDALLKEKISDDNATLLETVQEYTDNAVADKASVKFCIWEAND